jgi:hypothetical protein
MGEVNPHWKAPQKAKVPAFPQQFMPWRLRLIASHPIIQVELLNHTMADRDSTGSGDVPPSRR